MSREQQIKELEQKIEAQLQHCDVETTPKVCELIRNGNHEIIFESIKGYVLNDHLYIDQAILQVERDHNPNMIND